jgi:hypothetical protein
MGPADSGDCGNLRNLQMAANAQMSTSPLIFGNLTQAALLF